MKHTLVFSLLALVITSCSVKPEKKWFKGNLHTHSYWSDGDTYPEMIMDWYKSHGYNFVGLSDHNILAEGDKWIVIQSSKLYEDDFDNYLKKYGKDWVTYKNDTGRIQVKLKTLAQYQPKFADENFLIIKSEEITDGFEKKPIHMNVTNVQTLIQPQHGSSVTEVMQRNIDAVLKQREETGIPMFPHINHPNFFYGVSTQDIIDLRGERFFEVYNGHHMVNNYGDSLRPGTEEMWDLINIAYAKRDQPLLYGLATDDSHNYHQFGASYSNAGRGWVMVHTDSLTPASLIHALESGEFYASTGVTLDELAFEGNVIRIKIHSDPGVSYTTEFIGAKNGEEKTSVLKSSPDTETSFQITNELRFVRARIRSTKIKSNPFQEGDVEMAWTQPTRFQD